MLCTNSIYPCYCFPMGRIGTNIVALYKDHTTGYSNYVAPRVVISNRMSQKVSFKSKESYVICIIWTSISYTLSIPDMFCFEWLEWKEYIDIHLIISTCIKFSAELYALYNITVANPLSQKLTARCRTLRRAKLHSFFSMQKEHWYSIMTFSSVYYICLHCPLTHLAYMHLINEPSRTFRRWW